MEEKTRILEVVGTTVEDVEKAYEKAVAENYKYYVVIAEKSGKRYAIVDGNVKSIGEGEVGTNDKYVAVEVMDEPECGETHIFGEQEPSENETIEVEEEPTAKEDLAVEEEVVEEEKHCIAEVEHETVTILKTDYDAMCEREDLLKARNQELETRNIELNNEVGKLNSQIEELSLKNETFEHEVCQTTEPICFEDVVKFLKDNGLKSITID